MIKSFWLLPSTEYLAFPRSFGFIASSRLPPPPPPPRTYYYYYRFAGTVLLISPNNPPNCEIFESFIFSLLSCCPTTTRRGFLEMYCWSIPATYNNIVIPLADSMLHKDMEFTSCVGRSGQSNSKSVPRGVQNCSSSSRQIFCDDGSIQEEACEAPKRRAQWRRKPTR